MTAKELAKNLDGREYGNEITIAESAEAKAAGLVVAYGASDDLMEFDGAINGEVGAYGGRSIWVHNGALILPSNYCDEANSCPLFQKAIAQAKTISAVWHSKGNPCWTIETEIPHETFNIYEDGELFSVGIVFNVADTSEEPLNKPLTPNELQGMNGEIVWCEEFIKGVTSHYGIVHENKTTGHIVITGYTQDSATTENEVSDRGAYGLAWVAYLRKPEA